MGQRPSVLPADPEERALAWILEEYADVVLSRAVYQYKVELAKPPAERDPARLAETRAALDEQLRKLEAFLGDREFFVGNQYSVADVAVYAFLWAGEAVTGINMVQNFPRLDRWYARLKAM